MEAKATAVTGLLYEWAQGKDVLYMPKEFMVFFDGWG